MRTTLNILHHQGIDWLRELEFYNDELSILSGRLEEVMAQVSNDKEQAKQIWYFENRFVSLREQTDALTQDIIAREKKVEKTTEEMPGRIDEIIRLVDDKLFDRIGLLAKGVAAVRFEFNKFLSKKI